ncbi:MAG: acyloxyacyl hydrolase [Bacteroidales bacterium]|nr:acyloxyacyl hydrolase [Bacteroidales bacterium]MCF8454767.1 acyloxyacyl hydrolase [Bacteroidales bacterium]
MIVGRGFAEGGIKLPSSYNLESRFHYGFIWPHHESIRYLQRGHIPAFDLRISRTIVDKEWALLYRFPDIGIGYYHANLKWPKVLGNVDATYGFIKVPIIRHPRFRIIYSFAFGTAFMSEFFDLNDNYLNIAIGSGTNVYVNLGLETQWAFRDNLFFLLGADISHYSNGAIKKPNLGFNVPSINVGIKYAVKQAPNLSDPIKIPTTYRKLFDVQLISSFGLKEIHPAANDNYFISSISVDAGVMITRRKRMGLGLDVFYDASILDRMEDEGVEKVGELNNIRQGTHISYDLIFGKVYFTVQVGYYFLVDWNDDGDLYSRFGLQYHHRKMIYNLSLKTHMGRADYIEWGIGYVLFQR